MKTLSTAVFLTLAALPAAAQQSYPLVCRGGPTMVASVSGNGSVNLDFHPGGAGAGVGAPAAGECRWLDRGFRAGEPGRLALRRSGAADALYLLGAMLRGETFYAHVYNDGAGAMRITRVGP